MIVRLFYKKKCEYNFLPIVKREKELGASDISG